MNKLVTIESPIVAIDPINEALEIYTGFGRSSFPRARTNDLVMRFGPDIGADLRFVFSR